jgi:dienelactone hydrolase
VKTAEVAGQTVYFTGPDIKDGPLPAFFYFSLAGDESLQLDPFDTPVVLLREAPIRIFSLTLPAHGPGFDKHQAVAHWQEHPQEVEAFLPIAAKVIATLIDREAIDPTRLAAGGLSRGGFIATHLAALEPRIKAVVGFAPLIELAHLSLPTLVDKLTHTAIRFYVGNRDIAVGTDKVFAFIHALTEAAFQAGNRSPHAELYIRPSIGHRGHGTPADAFADGAAWIRGQLA